jgi:flagellar assembly protein FliH
MRSLSHFIPGEEIDAVSQWSFGPIDTASLRQAAAAKVHQESRDEEREQALRAEGFEQGFAQGHAHAVLDAQRGIDESAADQARDAAQRFAALFAAAQEHLAVSQQEMAQGVLELGCELARQVLRHELSVNPNALQPVIREALGILAADNKSAVVRLNPLDAEVLQDALQGEFAALSLTLVADPRVSPGGCFVESGGTVVDGALDTRWKRAVSSLGLVVEWEG